MRLNLFNKTLKIAYRNNLPYIWIQPSPKMSTGMDLQLVNTLAEQFNFQTEFIDCPGSYGSPLPNGTWTGIVGKLQANEVDLGIGGVSLSYQRRLAVNFLSTHWFDPLTFATPMPRKYIDFDLLKPFEPTIWIFICGTFVLFFILNLIKNLRDKHHPNRPGHSPNFIWICIGFIFRQSSIRLKTLPDSLRWLGIIWAVSVTMVLANLYSGFLYSMLTIPDIDVIDTGREFARACYYKKIIVLSSSNTITKEIFVPNSYSTTFSTIASAVQEVPSAKEGIHKLLREKPSDKQKQYAFVSSRDRLKFIKLIHYQNFFLPPNNEAGRFLSLSNAIPTRNSFEYRKPFNQVISRLVCSGIVHHWREMEILKTSIIRSEMMETPTAQNDYYAHENEDDDEDDDDDEEKFTNFSMDHFANVFWIFNIFIAVSFSIFLMEILMKRIKFRIHRKAIIQTFFLPP